MCLIAVMVEAGILGTVVGKVFPQSVDLGVSQKATGVHWLQCIYEWVTQWTMDQNVHCMDFCRRQTSGHDSETPTVCVSRTPEAPIIGAMTPTRWRGRDGMLACGGLYQKHPSGSLFLHYAR